MKRRKYLSLVMACILAVAMGACSPRGDVADDLVSDPEDTSREQIDFNIFDDQDDYVYDDEDDEDWEDEDDWDDDDQDPPPQNTQNQNTQTQQSSRAETSSDSSGESSGEGVEVQRVAARVDNPTAFHYSTAQVSAVYAYSITDFTYSPVTGESATQAVNYILKAGQGTTEDVYSSKDAGFFVVLDDNTKFTYNLIPTAVRGDGETYPMDPGDYSSLKAISDSANRSNASYIEWLVYMTPERVSGGTVYVGDGEGHTISSGNTVQAANVLKGIQVAKGTGDTYSRGQRSFEPAEGRTVVRLDFSSGVSYLIGFEGGKVYIESTDMTYGCEYTMSSALSGVESALLGL